jgi:hypothetical protein
VKFHLNYLEYLLQAHKWKEADEQSYNAMLIVAKKENSFLEDIEQCPCDIIRKIDQYWVRYSNGHFGFSVQKAIYLKTGNKLREYDDQSFFDFVKKVGWYKEKEGWNNIDYSLGMDAPLGYLPSRRYWNIGRYGSPLSLMRLARGELSVQERAARRRRVFDILVGIFISCCEL